MIELFLARYIYLFVLVLLAVGLYAVLAKTDLVKKVIGLTIFSTAIYLFFIEGSLQQGATAPVIDERGSDPSLYVDPLPHLLILTAIVVGVGVVGVALSLLVRIYRAHGSLDETVVAARLSERRHATLPPGEPSEAGPHLHRRGHADASDDAPGEDDREDGGRG